MTARTNPTSEWCRPTREIQTSLLIRLLDESRHGDAVVEMIHDAPTRQCPAAGVEHPEGARCDGMLIDLRSLGDSDPLTIEPATATLTYAPMTRHATAASAQSLAPGARRGRKRVASVRLLLCLSVLVFLCLACS